MKFMFFATTMVFCLIPISLYSQEKNTKIVLNKFQPLNKTDGDISNLISQKLEKEIAKLGYQTNLIQEENIQTALIESKKNGAHLLIGGYFTKNKYDNFDIYAQVYDPDKNIIIDSIIISDNFAGMEEIDLDKKEIKELEEKKINHLAEKLVLRIRVNAKKKIQQDNLTELENSTPSKKIKFPFPAKNNESQAAEVFKIIGENQIDRKVEVASLFKEDELKVGSTVSSIDETQWKKYGARRSHEALGHLPSVIHPEAGGGAFATSIRGYTSNVGFAGTARLIDGVPVNTFTNGSAVQSVVNFGLGNTNRIEMIRGPGSAIYGSDAFHGVYSIKAFESEKDVTEIYTEAGSSKFAHAYARASRGAFENKLRVHVSISGQGNGDQREPYISNLFGLAPKVSSVPAPFNSYPPIYDVSGFRKNQYENTTSTVKMDFKPTENLTIRTGFYYTAFEGQGFSGAGTNVALYKDTANSGYSKFNMGKFSLEYKLANDIILDATFYGMQSNMRTLAPIFFPPEFVDLSSYYVENRYGGTVTAKQSKNFLNTQWVANAGYNQFQIPLTNVKFDTPGSLTGLRVDSIFALRNQFQWQKSSFEGMKRDIKSAFFQTKTGFFNDRVYLLLGGRYDSYSDFGNQAIPRAGLIFMLTQNTAFKTLYGKAFRAPTAQDLSTGSIIIGNRNLKPETIDSFEVSLMHKEKFWKVNLILFENVWKNGIIRVLKSGLPAPSIAEAENKGVNQSRGAELEFYFNNNKWDFLLGGSHVISKDLTQPELINVNQSNFRVATNSEFFTAQNPGGKRYTLFPRYTLSAGVGYSFDWNKLTVFLINRLLSDFRDTAYNADNGTSRRLRNYSRLDFTISAEPTENFGLGLVVRNFTNRKNVVPGIYNNTYGIPDEELNASVRCMLKF